MQKDRFGRMLGLAVRAGGVVFGEAAVREAVRRKEVYLVIISSDASENTQKRLCNSCEFYGIRLLKAEDRFELGHICGRESAVTVGVKIKEIAENLSADSKQ